jgi:preprotein translocase subunit SecF
MEFFRIKKDIPFMRHALALNVVSLLTFVLAVFFLFHKGLNLSVEFTGGSILEVRYEQAPTLEPIRNRLTELGYHEAQVQQFGSARDILIRLPLKKGENSSQQTETVMSGLKQLNADASLSRADFVGGQVGEELAWDGVLALVFVALGIMVYLAVRFEWKFAVAGIIANLHDVVIILGCFAFFGWEFSLSVLAGVLAVLGYSVNESVIIFDRVRESFKNMDASASTQEVIDHAITSTISRTIITHGSTQMMVLAMLLFGGQALHYFAVALTIGILFGIYSSVFVAASLAMWFGLKREDLIKPPKSKKMDLNDPLSGSQV